MIKVWMLVLSVLLSLSAFSAEFSHIRLTPQFEQYLKAAELKSTTPLPQARAQRDLPGLVADKELLEQKFRTIILGSSPDAQPLLKARSNWTNPLPVDGEESPLYEEIRRHLESAHRDIGLGQVQQINMINRQFNLGSQNFSGFSWQRPFGVVQVYADRQVTPNLFGSNWLVADTFTFDIEASTFLERLADAGLADMSATEIAAFAGITFRRVYTYYHYANSYDEGLSADFSRLFLPFTRFNQSGMENMNNEEIMKREDFWSARAGGLISTPPLYNISFSAGALAEHAFSRTTTVQSTHNTPEQRYRLGVISRKSTEIGATLGLQLDFFKLLQLSLLRYDLSYQYASGKEFNLAVTPTQWEQVKKDQAQHEEWKKILKGFGELRHLEPYVVRLDESSSSQLQQRGSILIFGKLQKSKTEQVRVIKDQTVRVFYKTYAQSVKVVQNLLSRLFSAIIYKLLKFPIGASNAAMYARNFNMEYEATHHQAVDPNQMRIDSSEQFSLVISQSYDAARTDRWIDTKFKNDVIWFVDNFTLLPKDYKGIIRSEQLKGPLRAESFFRVEKNGLEFVVHSPENDVFGHIARVCESEILQEWTNESRRKKLLGRNQYGAESCVKSMGLKYLGFRSDYQANAFKPSLAKFRDFATSYYKEARSLHDLSQLFGPENCFIHGRLQATTSKGASFVTTFSSGQFRGLGVIDNFKRSTGSRAPASIVSE